MSLEALSRVTHKFFGSFAAPLGGAPHCPHAILDRIGNRTGCARSLVSRFGNVFSRSFRYGL
jgi:hypothetical protein